MRHSHKIYAPHSMVIPTINHLSTFGVRESMIKSITEEWCIIFISSQEE